MLLIVKIFPVFKMGSSVSVTAEIATVAGIPIGMCGLAESCTDLSVLDFFGGLISLEAGVFYKEGLEAEIVSGFEVDLTTGGMLSVSNFV